MMHIAVEIEMEPLTAIPSSFSACAVMYTQIQSMNPPNSPQIVNTYGSPKIGSIENDDSAMPIEKYCINNRGWAALFSFGRW
mmetsp:Transcript_64110/g.177156  ORF Transcript_64110/g.177156 Transcript_64110/m.177156 type:complete len:82 (+) Transcript_64110:1328-1573(+)